MINWPAVIKYHSDDELAYVASESAWNSDADLSAFDYEKSDVLIDSHGHVYRLDYKESGIVHPIFASNIISLYEFIKLVKLHASAQGECCIEKIVFRSVKEGMQLVDSMGEK